MSGLRYAALVIPYTMQDGMLVLDERWGQLDGPRVIDPTAELFRYADPEQTLPFTDLRAVAVVWVERMLRPPSAQGHAQLVPGMIHAVVLVPRRLPEQVVTILDAVATGVTPSGFSVLSAGAVVDQTGILFCNAGGALTARTTAKAVARLARLPMVELYGEGPVYRAPDRLDLSLLRSLAAAPPLADPGPPPADLAVSRRGGRLSLGLGSPPRSGLFWLLFAGVAAAISIPLLVVQPLFGGLGLTVAALLAGLAWRQRRAPGGQLIIEGDQRCWLEGEREPWEIDLAKLEMMRIHEATLVLITHQDEVRCEFPNEESAQWARLAITHQLAGGGPGPYR